MGRRFAIVSRVALILVVLGASVALAVSQGRLPQRTDRGEVATVVQPAVRVTGRARGLYPGKVGKLRVVVRNLNPFPIWLERVSVRAGEAAPGCPGSVLVVQPLRLHHRMWPGSRYRTWLRLTMLPAASDDCQGVTFPVTFRTRTKR